MYDVLYKINGYDPNGAYIGPVTGVISGDLALTTNRAGVLVVECTDSRFNGRDYQLEVLRSINNGPYKKVVDTRFLVRRAVEANPNRYTTTYTYTAYGLLTLLDRRIVAAYSGTIGATKTGPADIILQDYVREAFIYWIWNGFRAPPIQVDMTPVLLPNITKSFAWQPLPKVATEIVKTLLQTDGTHLYYDIIYGPYEVEFKTYIGQRGADRRYGVALNPSIFTMGKGNLTNIQVEKNWIDEKTCVFVGGKGNESARNIRIVEDTDSQGASLYSSAEIFVQGSYVDTNALLDDIGRGVLAANKAVDRFTADIVQTAGAMFGVDWEWGDYVTAYHNHRYYDARIESIHLSWDKTGEKIDARLYA